jgi:hypothetical protein
MSNLLKMFFCAFLLVSFQNGVRSAEGDHKPKLADGLEQKNCLAGAGTGGALWSELQDDEDPILTPLPAPDVAPDKEDQELEGGGGVAETVTGDSSRALEQACGSGVDVCRGRLAACKLNASAAEWASQLVWDPTQQSQQSLEAYPAYPDCFVQEGWPNDYGYGFEREMPECGYQANCGFTRGCDDLKKRLLVNAVSSSSDAVNHEFKFLINQKGANRSLVNSVYTTVQRGHRTRSLAMLLAKNGRTEPLRLLLSKRLIGSLCFCEIDLGHPDPVGRRRKRNSPKTPEIDMIAYTPMCYAVLGFVECLNGNKSLCDLCIKKDLSICMCYADVIALMIGFDGRGPLVQEMMQKVCSDNPREDDCDVYNYARTITLQIMIELQKAYGSSEEMQKQIDVLMREMDLLPEFAAQEAPVVHLQARAVSDSFDACGGGWTRLEESPAACSGRDEYYGYDEETAAEMGDGMIDPFGADQERFLSAGLSGTSALEVLENRRIMLEQISLNAKEKGLFYGPDRASADGEFERIAYEVISSGACTDRELLNVMVNSSDYIIHMVAFTGRLKPVMVLLQLDCGVDGKKKLNVYNCTPCHQAVSGFVSRSKKKNKDPLRRDCASIISLLLGSCPEDKETLFPAIYEILNKGFVWQEGSNHPYRTKMLVKQLLETLQQRNLAGEIFLQKATLQAIDYEQHSLSNRFGGFPPTSTSSQQVLLQADPAILHCAELQSNGVL